MNEKFKPFDARSAWNELAEGYEHHRLLSDSLDTLVEWLAQIHFVRDVRDKSILDLGCGSGAKALYFAEHGAKSVLGLDISDEFIGGWEAKGKPSNLHFIRTDINQLGECKELKGCQFDLILGFQVMGYAHDERQALRSMRELLTEDGIIIVMASSPIRMAVEARNKTVTTLNSDGVDLVCYPSRWNPSVILQHRRSTLSQRLNAIAESGLHLAEAFEPEFPGHFRNKYPEKAHWWDEHGGVILYRLEKR
ncbi:MAG TPA: class I SAM-dependent methyltransferase [Candidatus Kapabacteria bacterium]|nr:class I SAM-dependent methyltransferase [Candidatus Kapabacteria bacterium]